MKFEIFFIRAKLFGFGKNTSSSPKTNHSCRRNMCHTLFMIAIYCNPPNGRFAYYNYILNRNMFY